MPDRAPRAAPDRLFVRGLSFRGAHGVYEAERVQGSRFTVDVEVELLTSSEQCGDELERTLDYRKIATAVLDVASGPSRHLIETLANQMAARILERHAVASVDLTLTKYAEGIPGNPDSVGIRISRRRASR